jgi:erythronate-4-phosphate dehydrogenase
VRSGKVLGMNVLPNDPPLKRKTGNINFLELKELIKADIITFHVPLTLDGKDKTYHLFDYEKLNSLKDGTIIINASRGPVIDNSALTELNEKKKFTTVLDVWENEPEINTGLLKKIKYGTPHIAGYSFEGKVNGTKILYNALCKSLNKIPSWLPENTSTENSLIRVSGKKDPESALLSAIDQVYNISNDDKDLREIIDIDNKGKLFDTLRKNYKLRREFPNYTVKIDPFEDDLANIFRSFRFKVI